MFDKKEGYLPTLNLINCSFNSFYYSRPALIYIEIFGGNIFIENTDFKEFGNNNTIIYHDENFFSYFYYSQNIHEQTIMSLEKMRQFTQILFLNSVTLKNEAIQQGYSAINVSAKNFNATIQYVRMIQLNSSILGIIFYFENISFLNIKNCEIDTINDLILLQTYAVENLNIQNLTIYNSIFNTQSPIILKQGFFCNIFNVIFDKIISKASIFSLEEIKNTTINSLFVKSSDLDGLIKIATCTNCYFNASNLKLNLVNILNQILFVSNTQVLLENSEFTESESMSSPFLVISGSLKLKNLYFFDFIAKEDLFTLEKLVEALFLSLKIENLKAYRFLQQDFDAQDVVLKDSLISNSSFEVIFEFLNTFVDYRFRMENTHFNMVNKTSHYFFYLENGDWAITNSSFRNMYILDPIKHIYGFSWDIKSNILMQGLVFDNIGCIYQKPFSSFLAPTDDALLSFWETPSLIILNSKFIITKGLSSGFITSIPFGGSLFIHNSSFINLLENEEKFLYNSMFLAYPNQAYFTSNLFVGMRTNNYSFNQNYGGIYLYSDTSFQTKNDKQHILLLDNYFFDSKSKYGSAVAVQDYQNVLIINLISIDSRAEIGGSIYLKGIKNVVLYNLTIQNSFSKSEGGAIYLNYCVSVFLLKVFSLNTTSQKGGLIYIKNLKTMIIESLLIKNSKGEMKGGVFYVSYSSINVTDIVVIDSESNYFGGNMYFYNIFEINLRNILSTNSKSYSGGNIHVESGDILNIYNMTIKNSSSTNVGGAINIVELQNLKLIDMIIEKSKTDLSGIVFIASKQNNSKVEVKGFTCLENSANQGSCIFHSSSSSIFLQKLNIFSNLNNTIKITWSLRIDVEIIDCVIWNNLVLNDLTYFEGVDILFLNLKFFKNEVGLNLIYIEDSNSTFISLNLTQNSHIDKISKDKTNYHFLIKDSISFFRDIFISENMNFAYIFTQKSIFNISNCSLSNSNSSENKNLNLQSSSIQFKFCAFYENKGGVFYLEDSNLTLISTIYHSSSFSTFFLYLNNGFLVLSECIFIFLPFENLIQFFNLQSLDICKGFFIGKVDLLKKLDGNYNDFSCFFGQNVINVTITKTHYENLIGQKGVVLHLIDDHQLTNVHIDDSLFSKIYGLQSSVFYFSSLSSLFINSSLFLINKAQNLSQNESTGIASILFYPSSSVIPTILIENNIFYSNTADYFCSLFYIPSKITLPNSSNLFLDNWNPFDIAQLSYPPIPILISNPSSIKSGEAFNLIFKVCPFDFRSGIDIKPLQQANQSFLLQNNMEIANQGIFNFSQLTVFGTPGSTISLGMYFRWFDPIKLYYTIIPFSIPILLSIRPCKRGEVLTTTSLLCTKCPSGTYSLLDPMAYPHAKCKNCLLNAECPGGDEIKLDPGFWRLNADSELIVQCIDGPDTCLGGGVIEANACYEGNYDELCRFCKNGYGRTKDFGRCAPCNDYLTVLVVRMVGIFLAFNIYIAAATYYSGGEGSGNIEISIGLKLLLNYLQQYGILFSFYYIKKFPFNINIFSFSDFSYVITSDYLSSDCFYDTNLFSGSEFDLTLFKIRFNLISLGLSPLITPLLMFAFYLFKRRASWRLIFVKVTISFIIANYIFYPFVLQSCLRLFECTKLSDKISKTYVYRYPNVECWEIDHAKLVKGAGIPILIIWGLLLPSGLFILLKFVSRKTKNLRIKLNIKNLKVDFMKSKTYLNFNSARISTDMISSSQERITRILKIKEAREYLNYFRYSTEGYKFDYLYWDSAIFLRKFAFILFANMHNLLDFELRLYFNLLTLFFFLNLTIKYLPFVKNKHNQIEIISLGIFIITTVLQAEEIDKELGDYSAFIKNVVLLLCNVLFLIFLIINVISQIVLQIIHRF